MRSAVEGSSYTRHRLIGANREAQPQIPTFADGCRLKGRSATSRTSEVCSRLITFIAVSSWGLIGQSVVGGIASYLAPFNRSAMRSAMATVVKWVLARGTSGMIEASITRNPVHPITRHS